MVDIAPEEMEPGDLAQVRFRKLRELGLTEYQAKAYMALVRLGKGTAAQLAKVTDVPRNKLYPVMQQLNQLGIVETLLGEAQVFRPLPIDRFLAERLQAMRTRVEDLDRSRADLAAMFLPASEPLEPAAAGYRLYHGRANTVDQLREALRAARSDVLLAGGQGSAARMLASGEAELLRERLDDGVRALVVLPSQQDPGAAQELAAMLAGGVRVAPDFPGGVLLATVDDHRSLQVQLQPDDGNPHRGNDVCLVSQSPLLARLVAHVARAAWDGAVAPGEQVERATPSEAPYREAA